MAQFTIDDREFQAALKLYAENSKRELPYILNRTAKDIAFRAAEFMPRADKGAIDALPDSLPDNQWCKYIAAIIARGEGKFTQTSRKTKKHKLIKVKAAGLTFSQFRSQARRVSRFILNARKRSIGLLASGMAKAGLAIQGGYSGKGAILLRTGLDHAKGWGTSARPSDVPTAGLNIAYEVHNRESAVAKAYPYFKAAVAYKTQDMLQYVRDKLYKLGQQVSSKK